MTTHERGAKLVLMERSDESVTSSCGGIEQLLTPFPLAVSWVLDLDPVTRWFLRHPIWWILTLADDALQVRFHDLFKQQSLSKGSINWYWPDLRCRTNGFPMRCGRNCRSPALYSMPLWRNELDIAIWRGYSRKPSTVAGRTKVQRVDCHWFVKHHCSPSFYRQTAECFS